MNGSVLQARRGHRLDPPGDLYGVSCDGNGPALGPIRFLVKTRAGFEPYSAEELDGVLSWTFARPKSCAGMMPGLRAIARALNDGDLSRAMIATQFLHLPLLSKAEARRAADVTMLFKAAADDPKHPGWPAGTPGSVGGEYRPKDGALSLVDARRIALSNARRVVLRRAIRTALRDILTWRRLARLAGEAASNAVPLLDFVGDAAMAADIAGMLADAEQLKSDTDVALEFSNRGPFTLDQLRVDPKNISYSSFDAFKKIDLIKRYGPAGKGYEYHHIVEQNARGDIPQSELQSTSNIIRIPKLLHDEIDSEYSRTSSDDGPGVSVRKSLRGKSFEDRWEQGIKTLRDIGILR